jgi:protein-arginine kinase activator protein McsA
MIKQKKCCGTGIAKGYGCGKLTNVEYRIYGLGKMCGCYSDWLINSENGKIKMQKAIIKAQKPRLELEQAHKEKNEKKGITGALLITKTVVHAYVRERDHGKKCISCNTPWNKEFQAGHFYASGSFETLRFNLDNIHGQCQQCNLYNHGNFENYSLNLPNRIGQERFKKLTELASIDKQFSKVWNLENLKEIRDNIKKLRKNL